MKCAVSLSHEGAVLSPRALVSLVAQRGLLSITFRSDHSEFTIDYSPSNGLSPQKSCHLEGSDQLGRQSWLSACSLDNLALILRTSDNVYRLIVTEQGQFVLVPETHPSCEISSGHRWKRQNRVAKSNPDYYADFADILQRRRYVEFAFVADYSIYEKYEKEEEKVIERLETLANMMNSFYKPINIEIRLVYTEVWKDNDKIEVTADSDATLDAFLKYRKRFLRAHPNDNAHLLTQVRFGNAVIGKAFKGTMCSFDYSGGVNVDHHTDAALVASTIAHEMGHNFGMDHDPDYTTTCQCPKNRNAVTHCLMATSAGYEAPSHWSDCSLNYLQTSLGRGVDLCLLNEPDHAGKAVCGNGIVEDGEDCDCGPNGCNHECCDASTCRLATKAECAAGQCCDLTVCRPKQRATECRSATNSCDLAEFCDGETAECPADFFVQDGLNCPHDDEGYCYNGECGSRREQCRKIWGDTGKAASDACYLTNTKGTIHGNCGYDAHFDNYTACLDKDKYCGRLHCDKDTEAPIFGNPSSVVVANSHFFNRDKNIHESCFVIKTAYETINKRKHTPGMVLDGTKCGKNKVCLQNQCVNLDVIKKTASKCENDCYGHGICNNVGNCHCDNNYGGVACNIPGLGGSVNSNPANMGRGMDVFICSLVLLFLIVVFFIGLSIEYKRRGKGFLPGILWKRAKEKLKLRGVLIPTRKAPPPPRSRMQKNNLNDAWNDGVVTYTAHPAPLISSTLTDQLGLASPASSPDPLIGNGAKHYNKPSTTTSSISPRPRGPPPSIPSRPRDSAIVQLHSNHAHELGIRPQAPPPPSLPKGALNRADSLNRPAVNPPPPPPPHKPKEAPPIPSKPSISKPQSVRGLAAKFERT